MRIQPAILIAFAIGLSSISAQARIRLRKVKEAPRVCQLMVEDKLLSRPEKKVLSTEKHSLIFEDGITLVRDKGEKVCNWRVSEFESLGALDQFNFFIDEYREVLYSYVKNPEASVLIIATPFATCSLESKVTLPEFQQPKCDKPKKTSKSKKKSKKKKTN
jgi:hypothetical protein